VSPQVLTFFNDRGSVGRTSLVFHVAWMLAEMDRQVLVVDLDPQADLTAAFLEEAALADPWDRRAPGEADTIHRCLLPLARTGAAREPQLRRISDRLSLLPGDPALSGFEELLAAEWPGNPGRHGPRRSLRHTQLALAGSADERCQMRGGHRSG
jgi:cellulose biosynthesis protein BcsQ